MEARLRLKYRELDRGDQPIPNSFFPKEVEDKVWKGVAHLPPNAEIFEWPFPPPLGSTLAVAYDMILPKGAAVHVHQARPEDDVDERRFAHFVGAGAMGEMHAYSWGNSSKPFVAAASGFSTLVVPAHLPVMIAIWMPIYQHEELFEVK